MMCYYLNVQFLGQRVNVVFDFTVLVFIYNSKYEDLDLKSETRL